MEAHGLSAHSFPFPKLNANLLVKPRMPLPSLTPWMAPCALGIKYKLTGGHLASTHLSVHLSTSCVTLSYTHLPTLHPSHPPPSVGHRRLCWFALPPPHLGNPPHYEPTHHFLWGALMDPQLPVLNEELFLSASRETNFPVSKTL